MKYWCSIGVLNSGQPRGVQTMAHITCTSCSGGLDRFGSSGLALGPEVHI